MIFSKISLWGSLALGTRAVQKEDRLAWNAFDQKEGARHEDFTCEYGRKRRDG